MSFFLLLTLTTSYTYLILYYTQREKESNERDTLLLPAEAALQNCDPREGPY